MNFLKLVHTQLTEESREGERKEKEQELTSQFAEKAERLLWDFGPLKWKQYDFKYGYSYRDPCIDQTPEVQFAENISVYLEGEWEEDPDLYVHPNSVVAKRLSLCFKKGGEITSLSMTFDSGTQNPNKDELPSIENIQKGLVVLDWLEQEYKSHLKPNVESSFAANPDL